MRLGRLGHDPLARPAPITCSDAPKRKVEDPKPAPNPSAKPAIATFASLTPEQRNKGKSNRKASTLPHRWPKVIEAILAKTKWTAKTLAEKLDVSPSTVSCWRSGRFVPIVGKDREIVAIYTLRVGGPLP